jgi:hypothetical protein
VYKDGWLLLLSAKQTRVEDGGDPERTEPTLWKANQSENAKLKGELVACEKEKKSRNDLVHHIGETVLRHVKGKG